MTWPYNLPSLFFACRFLIPPFSSLHISPLSLLPPPHTHTHTRSIIWGNRGSHRTDTIDQWWGVYVGGLRVVERAGHPFTPFLLLVYLFSPPSPSFPPSPFLPPSPSLAPSLPPSLCPQSVENKVTAILPMFRVSAHARPTLGSHTAVHDGIYEIIWDNTYSRWLLCEWPVTCLKFTAMEVGFFIKFISGCTDIVL